MIMKENCIDIVKSYNILKELQMPQHFYDSIILLCHQIIDFYISNISEYFLNGTILLLLF